MATRPPSEQDWGPSACRVSTTEPHLLLSSPLCSYCVSRNYNPEGSLTTLLCARCPYDRTGSTCIGEGHAETLSALQLSWIPGALSQVTVHISSWVYESCACHQLLDGSSGRVAGACSACYRQLPGSVQQPRRMLPCCPAAQWPPLHAKRAAQPAMMHPPA